MGRTNLKELAEKTLTLNLKTCSIYEGKVTGNTAACSKVHVPTEWVGKTVLVVLRNG